jgi:hypothetical protein
VNASQLFNFLKKLSVMSGFKLTHNGWVYE